MPALANWAGNSSARVSGAGSRARDSMCPHEPSDGDGLGEGSRGEGRAEVFGCCESAVVVVWPWPRANQK